MISDRVLLIGLLLVALVLFAIGQTDDAMAACQLRHSFGTCHDAIN